MCRDVDQKLFFKKLSDLPSPPEVLHRIAQTTANPSASAAQIEQALRLDPSISGKVLRLANSAYIGMPHSIASLHHAIVLLGNRRIHALVLGSELLCMMKNNQKIHISLTRYWHHCVLTALIAESIAKYLKRYDPIDEHSIFSGAMLHDIGKLVIELGVAGSTREIYDTSVTKKIPYYKAETEGLSHRNAGEYIALQWNFPEDLKIFIRDHHNPLNNKEKSRNTAVVHVADVMSHVLGFSVFPDEIIPSVAQDALGLIELPMERLKVIAENALQEKKRFESLVELFS
jgi:putative nucleotidyltransferase with HDIG domain